MLDYRVMHTIFWIFVRPEPAYKFSLLFVVCLKHLGQQYGSEEYSVESVDSGGIMTVR